MQAIKIGPFITAYQYDAFQEGMASGHEKIFCRPPLHDGSHVYLAMHRRHCAGGAGGVLQIQVYGLWAST